MKLRLCRRDDRELEIRTIGFSSDFEGRLNAIRSLPGRKWDPAHRCWLIPYHLRSLDAFLQSFEREAIEIDEALLEADPYLKQWQEGDAAG